MLIKRLFDVCFSIITLIILSILILIISLAIRLFMGKPILFRQKRIGYKKVPFTIFKFRTMKEIEGPDNIRLTKIGKFLRKTSIDELPQLWNVIKGDLSLVGPRPFPVKYLPYFTEQECLRFTVIPGITGLAQIYGRNELNWDDRFAQDVWYVKNWNLSLDFKILWHTVIIVFARKGVVVDARSIMLNLDEERSNMVKNCN